MIAIVNFLAKAQSYIRRFLLYDHRPQPKVYVLNGASESWGPEEDHFLDHFTCSMVPR